jgi:superfamily II DNA or RNA helicase/HKD family nuclease
MSRDKNLIDLISSYKTKMMDEPEVDLPDNLQWLLDQFQFLIRNKLTKFNNQSERVNYLNHLTSNLFNLKNGRYLSKVDSVNDKWLDELTTTKIYDKEIYKNIISELETCEEAIIVSPFISFNIIELKNTIESNKKLKRLTVLTTTFGFREKMNINLDLLKKIKEINPEVIDIKIENVTENNALKRLHAKAYYFKRENQLSSLYIGSSNFSHTGLNTGLEYNMKISEFTNPHIFESFLQYVRNIEESEMPNDDNESFKQNTMENNFYNINNKFFMGYLSSLKLWIDNNKQKIAEQLKNLDLTQESINGDVEIPKSFEMENALFKYQISAIKQLNARFTEGKRQHLLAMATGTGKTTIAVSYVNEISKRNGFLYKPSVLFIAHRTEILDQAKERFIDWGVYDKEDILELYDSRAKGSSLDSSKFKLILGSVSTLNNNLEQLQKQKFDITIFDEAHHIDAEGAKTFNNIFEIGKEISNEVLGMSATPERTNGNNIIDLFGGEFAYTLSVYDALEKEYLAPFDYYMLHSDDVIDFDFSKKSNENQLTKFMKTEERFKLLTQAINSCINADENICCVIFCNSRKTAKYMSDRLNAIGKKADYLVSESEKIKDRKKDWKEERKKTLRNFKTGVINYLCVVDIFNEGVDIPEINNVIFLRPTSSKLIFLQQLGRGLRKFNDKRLRIIDIVNNINISNINDDLIPLSYMSSLFKNKETYCTFDLFGSPKVIGNLLPPNCNFYYDKKTESAIKENLKLLMKTNKKVLLKALNNNKDVDYKSYKEFITNYFNNPAELYMTNSQDGGKERKLSFLSLEKHEVESLRMLSGINIKKVLQKMLDMIDFDRMSDNKIVNNLFLRIIFNTKNRLLEPKGDYNQIVESMFKGMSKKFKTEFSYLCKYKLEMQEHELLDNDINSNIKSFIGLTIEEQIVSSFASDNVVFEELHKDYQQKGIYSLSYNDKSIAIVAGKPSKKHKYDDYYDETKKMLLWITEEGWIKRSESSKQKRDVSDSNVKKFIFFYTGIENGAKLFTFEGISTKTKVVTNNDPEYDENQMKYYIYIND